MLLVLRLSLAIAAGSLGGGLVFGTHFGADDQYRVMATLPV